MRQAFLGVPVLYLIASVLAYSQSVCPDISIRMPRGMLQVDATETFEAVLVGGRIPPGVSFTWASTHGTIASELGSPTMRLTTRREDNGANATVFVRVEGLPSECSDSTSEVIGIASLPIGDPLDRFGRASVNVVKAGIDNYFISLNRYPEGTGLIDMYFSPEETRAQRIDRIKTIVEFVRFRKYNIRKLEFAFHESKIKGAMETVLWVVPPGVNRKWILEDRPGAVFVKGEVVMRNPETALPKRQCLCTWK